MHPLGLFAMVLNTDTCPKFVYATRFAQFTESRKSQPLAKISKSNQDATLIGSPQTTGAAPLRYRNVHAEREDAMACGRETLVLLSPNRPKACKTECVYLSRSLSVTSHRLPTTAGLEHRVSDHPPFPCMGQTYAPACMYASGVPVSSNSPWSLR